MKYKVGDRVKIVANTTSHEYDIGEVVTIFKVNEGDYLCNDMEGWFVTDEEVELVGSMQKLKVIKAQSVSLWYSNEIGKTFEITRWDESGEPWVTVYGEDEYGIVRVGDFELIDESKELVHSPKHYSLFEGTEVIEIIARSMTQDEFRGFCFGNLLKYKLRCGLKDDVMQELSKAEKYKELYEKYKSLCIYVE